MDRGRVTMDRARVTTDRGRPTMDHAQASSERRLLHLIEPGVPIVEVRVTALHSTLYATAFAFLLFFLSFANLASTPSTVRKRSSLPSCEWRATRDAYLTFSRRKS